MSEEVGRQGAFSATQPVATAANPSLDATQVADTPLGSTQPSHLQNAGSLPPPSPLVRSTVLPRVSSGSDPVVLSLEPKSRFEPVKVLGAGGMGEVVLVSDRDIDRKV